MSVRYSPNRQFDTYPNFTLALLDPYSYLTLTMSLPSSNSVYGLCGFNLVCVFELYCVFSSFNVCFWTLMCVCWTLLCAF